MALIDSVKPYLKVDEDEDVQVQELIDSAAGYLTGAGIPQDETNPLYVLAIKMLTVHWHENREPIGSSSKIAFGLEGIITQLQNN